MPQLAHWATRRPTHVALLIHESGEAITYAALDARANRAAQWLIGLGLQPGDGIALLLENRIAMLELAWAARRAGLYYTPLSVHLKPVEIAYVLEDSGARLLIESPHLAAQLETAIPRISVEKGYEAALAAYPDVTPLPERPVGRDFLYSSGTTGMPKGVRRALTPFESRLAPDWPDYWLPLYGFGEETVYLSPAPLYHAAPHRYVLRTLMLGGTVVIMRKFDAEAALTAITQHRVTHSQWVPTMFSRLLALPATQRAAHDLSSHRCAIHAAAPCPIPLKQAMIEWWGPIIHEYYAGSESVGITVIDSQEWLAHPGSVGRPRSGAVHILDDAGRVLPAGEVGGIWFSGATRFAYHNAPDKTASAYNADGLATYGDLGHLDAEGYLYLSDRRADLILSGGVNVYPWEIEQVLALHPAVADACVVGVPDADFGEAARAVVVARDAVEPAALIAFCKARLAGPKVPRSVVFVDDLPRSEAGKLLRREVKAAQRSA
jgi:acyl-CoA synthetase (AMP-forming)/AMP-acid ligase II